MGCAGVARLHSDDIILIRGCPLDRRIDAGFLPFRMCRKSLRTRRSQVQFLPGAPFSFNPFNKLRPGNPLNPITTVDPNNPFYPINRIDPGNPVNPLNRFNLNNPLDPLNPVNRYNPIRHLNCYARQVSRPRLDPLPVDRVSSACFGVPVFRIA